jgi:hypothetical protein
VNTLHKGADDDDDDDDNNNDKKIFPVIFTQNKCYLLSKELCSSIFDMTLAESRVKRGIHFIELIIGKQEIAGGEMELMLRPSGMSVTPSTAGITRLV